MNTGANSYINSSKNRKGACDFLRWQLTDTLKHFAFRQTTAKGGDLKAKRSVGVHWGTFALTDEPLDQPPKDLAVAVASKALGPQDFTLMAIGETRQLPTRAAP